MPKNLIIESALRLSPTTIQVFYKLVQSNGEIIYYQKDLPLLKIIEFELTNADIVAKNANEVKAPK